jgi:hypothetical protein
MKLPSEFANEIARLMRDPDALRGRHGHYDPNQPRVPAGNPKGGQWTDKGSGGGAQTSEEINKEIARLMRDPDALRHERAGMPVFGRRAPAGHPEDETWPDTGSIDTTTAFGGREQPQLARFPLPDTSPIRPPVLPGPPPIRPPVLPGAPIVTLLALFAALSAENSPEQRAIFEFNAKRFRRDPHGALDRANVDVLNREQVENECKKLDEVQRRTDKAVDNVNNRNTSTGVYMSPSQFGTAVHKSLKDQIENLKNPNLRAEVSYWKMQEDNVYGRPGSIRVDVLERTDQNVVCVYDIKTGQSRRSGLTPARMLEIAKNVLTAYPDARHVIVTEVRPTR